jgi:hypothetical protein
MKFLLDVSPNKLEQRLSEFSDLIAGQLLTPLTRYNNAGGLFAIDNGAFSGFKKKDFKSLLEREHENKDRCLFVVVPDVVGNGKRTLEIWHLRHNIIHGWPKALVIQDGIEDLDIPWSELQAVFVGGNDPWKDSRAVVDIVKTALILDKHIHVGRVNTIKRFVKFEELGAHTCDGSGASMYDHMLEDIAKAKQQGPHPVLWEE